MLSKDRNNTHLVCCDTGSEHEDSNRFEQDCIRHLNAPVTHLKSDTYVDAWDVWQKTRWLAGIEGARCTVELKVIPRLDFQKVDDTHVFGYTADSLDVARSEKLRENYPELSIETPLIDAGLTKASCLAMIENWDIKLPITYGLGFPNNNCIPCVKATSPAYWALIRKHFPVEFEKMVKISRELGVRLSRLNNERIFIDEIPLDHATTNPIVPSCDFLCHIIEQDITE